MYACVFLRLFGVGWSDIIGDGYDVVSRRQTTIVPVNLYNTSCSSIACSDQNQTTPLLSYRADIVDRNGILLARSIDTWSVYAHPRYIVNIDRAVAKLSNVLDMSIDNTKKILLSNGNFVWLKRNVSLEEKNKIIKLGIDGVEAISDFKRFYPHGNLCAHAIGYVDIDSNGLGGIERSHDIRLKTNSYPLKLALDVRIQAILRDEIQKSVQLNDGSAGMGIIANVKTGEILSMVSFPDFDPNKPISIQDKRYVFNQSTLGVHEVGSVMKALTVAMALDSKTISINDTFNITGPFKLGRFKIHDYKGRDGIMNVSQILVRSSNIGIAQIAQKLGVKRQREYLRKFGVLSAIDIELMEVGRPMFPGEKRWKDTELVTIAYGHGIAVTPLHMIRAYIGMLNGVQKKLTMMATDDVVDKDYDHKASRIISSETSHAMKQLLRLAVESGTVKRADVQGYDVIGKTGTAEKVKGGKYEKKSNLAICMVAFPMNDPQYIMFIGIDEAKPTEFNKGFATGGMVAAELAGDLIRKLVGVLGVAGDMNEVNVFKKNDIVGADVITQEDTRKYPILARYRSIYGKSMMQANNENIAKTKLLASNR